MPARGPVRAREREPERQQGREQEPPQVRGPARQQDSDWTGLSVDGARLMLTDGRCAQDIAAQIGSLGVDCRPIGKIVGGSGKVRYADASQ